MCHVGAQCDVSAVENMAFIKRSAKRASLGDSSSLIVVPLSRNT